MSWQLMSEGSFDTATGTGMCTATSVQLAHSGGTAIVEDLYNNPIMAIACEDLSINSAPVSSTLFSSGTLIPK